MLNANSFITRHSILYCYKREFPKRLLRNLANSETQPDVKSTTAKAQTQTSNENTEGKTSRGNYPSFRKVLNLLNSRKRRKKTGKVVIEGNTLINDAITAGAELECIFYKEEKSLLGLLFDKIPHMKFKKVINEKEINLWSELNTYPQTIGLLKIPDYENLIHLNKRRLPLTIICDNVREPGNLASIIHCGAALGCQRVILMKGCVDAWESKVLRNAHGAHFFIPIVNGIPWNDLGNYIPQNANLFLADNSDTSLDDKANFANKNTTEEAQHNYKLLNYMEVEYDKDCILLIGGETEGISSEALTLLSELNGNRIKISMENNVESLNLAVAMAIIGFEIKRQICKS